MWTGVILVYNSLFSVRLTERTFGWASGYLYLRPVQVYRFNSTQLNSTGQLSCIGRHGRAYNSTQLNSTGFRVQMQVLDNRKPVVTQLSVVQVNRRYELYNNFSPSAVTSRRWYSTWPSTMMLRWLFQKNRCK
jgi:hypothetical protein